MGPNPNNWSGLNTTRTLAVHPSFSTWLTRSQYIIHSVGSIYIFELLPSWAATVPPLSHLHSVSLIFSVVVLLWLVSPVLFDDGGAAAVRLVISLYCGHIWNLYCGWETIEGKAFANGCGREGIGILAIKLFLGHSESSSEHLLGMETMRLTLPKTWLDRKPIGTWEIILALCGVT